MARENRIHKVRAFREFYRHGNDIELAIVCRDDEDRDKKHVFNGEKWDCVAPQLSVRGIVLNEAQAQELCNDLFDLGIRPAGAAGSIGQLSATEKHLNDMREIAFAKLGIKKNA